MNQELMISPEVSQLLQEQQGDEAQAFGGSLMPSAKNALKIGGRLIRTAANPLTYINSLTGGTAVETGKSGFEGKGYSKDSKGQRIVTSHEKRLDNLVDWGEGGLMTTQRGKSQPLVFFHASPNFQGNEFKMELSQARDSGWLSQGGYVTTRHDVQTLDQYTRWLGKEGEAPEVLPLFIKMNKPLTLTRSIDEVGWDAYRIPHEDRNLIQNKLINMRMDFENITDPEEIAEFRMSEMDNLDSIEYFKPEHIETYLEGSGYTSKDMTVTEFLQQADLGYDGVILREPGNPDDIPEGVIFDPKQAKSVFNRGFFNKATNDLLSKAQEKDPQIYS